MPNAPTVQKATALTETIIAAAIEVHRDKGPGLIESIYEWLSTSRALDCAASRVSARNRF